MPVVAEWRPAPVPEHAATLIASGYPKRLADLLARRGVRSPEEAEAFLSPSIDQLHDPLLLAGLPEALDRLLAAREGAETVAVVGDYDVDGVTASALLTAVLRACGLVVEPVLPHRLREGYGFQPVHVERAAALGCRLIVTVDCGVSSGEAIRAAHGEGIDVIVTDHHLPGDSLPDGAILINPRQDGCLYPFADLAGVGLAFKLAIGFAERTGRRLSLEPLLRIACLGTIADVVPLVGENRTIAALGLAALADTRSVGLQALMRQAGVKKPVKASDVGFRIGPRINAAGRLADPKRALDLLLSRDRQEAEALAQELEERNRERQDAERKAVREAMERFADREPRPSIAVAWSEEWHKGVVGIAAGRLTRRFHRPAILFSVDGELATGSGRSVAGIGLHDFVSAWADRYERFGGHSQAIGLTVRSDRLPELARTWEEESAAWPPELLRPCFQYELELPASETDRELLDELGRLEPHGEANPQPLLKIGPLELEREPRRFGNGHLSAAARGADGGRVQLLGWGWQEREGDLGGAFEALGYLEHDSYRDAPVVRLRDARPL